MSTGDADSHDLLVDVSTGEPADMTSPGKADLSVLDKPLPNPPADSPSKRRGMGSSNWRSALEAGQLQNTESAPQDIHPAPIPSSPIPGVERLKIKVPWGKKNITIALPLNDNRGKKGNGLRIMTQKDITTMLRDYQQLGYNTSGFDLNFVDEDDSPASQGQSRVIWPDATAAEQEFQEARDAKRFTVSIPDKADWDAYVQELKEAKLRALGVTMADEEPAPTISPATSAALSRKTSLQYPPLPFSPPIPTSSGSSSHATQHQLPFSPILMGAAGPSTSQSSNVGSVASPASMHGQIPGHMHGKHNPRQSISISVTDHPLGSPPQYSHQSPGIWPQQPIVFPPGMPRGNSPGLQNLSAVLSSPASPFGQDGYFPPNELALQMQQRQQLLQNQIQQHMLQRTRSAVVSPLLQETPSEQDEIAQAEISEKSPSKTPDASQFMQTTHRQNASLSLQQEIDDAEYHLEEQFQRQLEHDEDYSPHSEKAVNLPEQETTDVEHSEPKLEVKDHARQVSIQEPAGLAASRFADDSDGPVLHHPQPHSRGHSLSQRPFGDHEDNIFNKNAKIDTESEIDTNPSHLASPVLQQSQPRERSLSEATNPWLDAVGPLPTKDKVETKKLGHAAKPSLSRLNVSAPEFKFDPTHSSFKPTGQFSFGPSSFAPTSAINSSFGNPFNINATAAPTFGGSKINISAPPFKPGQSEFSFSSSGPSFRPDAPAFTPHQSYLSDSVGSGGSGNEGAPNNQPSIFGKIDINSLAGIVRPPKKSKAIPIVRPDSGNRAKEEEILPEEPQEEDGRITQDATRIKRAKGNDDDGDAVPLFAEPTMPLQETSRDQSPPKEVVPTKHSQADKENSVPLDAEKESLTIEPISAAKAITKGRPRSTLEDSPDYDGKGWAPFEFQQQKQVEDFNAASAYPVSTHSHDEDAGEAKPEPEVKEDGLPVSISPAVTAITEQKKQHKKNSLSALAKPFEFGSNWFRLGSNDTAKQATTSSNTGLSSSKYATSSPPLPPEPKESPELSFDALDKSAFQESLPQPQSPPPYPKDETESVDNEPTFEEIDAVMRHLNETEDLGVNRGTVTPRWHQPSPVKRIEVPDADTSSPLRLPATNLMRSDAPSPSPRRFQGLPEGRGQKVFAKVESDDPFVADARTIGLALDSPVHHLNATNSVPPSEWDDVLSESEEPKFHARTQFFDNHVNELVGGLLAEKLDPLERALEIIQVSISSMSQRTPSSRRDRRSMSAELPESDADDEDDEQLPRRSASPRRDRKLEKIRNAVADALAAYQPPIPSDTSAQGSPDAKILMQKLDEMREQFGQSMRLDLRGEDLRNIVEEAVERRLPASPKAEIDEVAKVKIADLEERLADLNDRLKYADEKTENEVKERRAAEDRLAEIQRQLRISSEEEVRLRETLEEREQKLKSLEDSRSKHTMRTALLEANAENAQKGQSDLANRLNLAENELRQARQQAQHWQVEAEKALDAANADKGAAELANETNLSLRRTIESLKVQMEESLRTREVMRSKLGALQEDMAKAAREVSQENAKRAKREQELNARQEVLDARLQAEARTRERLEREIERLEAGERDGMRAVNEGKKLETLIVELRTEAHEAQKSALKYQREFEEARESGLSEVQRTRNYLQAEVEAASHQVNLVRQELEEQVSRLRSELDQARLDADTARARADMLLEEANDSKRRDLAELAQKHDNELEDIQTQHERQLNNAMEDAQRSEQQLLERLSLSAAKTEHLQDRVIHLEEKLEIAKDAARAAADAARSANVTSPPAQKAPVAARMELPEKISPQALRESIMVLQEQLQDREQTIEKLEHQLSLVDLDAPTKISKRDDEIMWLRELLHVRLGDLQDIINSIQEENFDPERVKDAAIRLKANLQMEEQERERAMNGGSALSLPNIAASLREAATPRVAQVVGPMAAAWGSWRKAREAGIGNLSEMMTTTSNTPSKSSPGAQSFLSGLMTPPASGLRQTSPQPSAFSNTGKRYTAQQLANRSRNSTPRKGKAPLREDGPATPPMMRKSSYDQDAKAEDFSDAGFYDDDESTVDENMFGANLAR